MNVRQELIQHTGLTQGPRESASKFSRRLWQAVGADRANLSPTAIAWLALGDTLYYKPHDGPCDASCFGHFDN